MSFLPYADSGPFGWLLAGGGSLVAHSAAVSGLLVALHGVQIDDVIPEPSQTFEVVINPIDTGISPTELGVEDPDPTETEQTQLPEEITEAEDLAAPEAIAPTEDGPALGNEADVQELDPTTLGEELVGEDVQEAEALTATEPSDVAQTAEIAATELQSEEVTGSDVAEAEQVLEEPFAPLLVPDAPQFIDGTTGFSELNSGSGSGEVIGAETLGGVELAALPAPETSQGQPPIAQGQTEGEAVAGRDVSPPLSPQIRAALPELSPRDAALVELIERLRRVPKDPCLLSLPRRAGVDGIGLSLIADSDLKITDFLEKIENDLPEEVSLSRTLIDARQCAALDFFKLGQDYPAVRLGLRIDAPVVVSGQSLGGVISGISDKEFRLLLIDNNGVVQDLSRFVALAGIGNLARFEVPVTRVGPVRDTAQLLIALASDSPMTDLDERIGNLAENALSGLPASIETEAASAIVSFEVR